jgi:LPXTG-motif cell wall-anchored protein
MTTQPVPQTAPARGTITRSLLAVALLVLAGLIIWVGLTRADSSQLGVVLLSVLLPVAAAGLLFVRRSIGATVAVFAALLGAVYGFLLSVCLFCPPPPLSPEAVAIFATSAVIYALALLELRTLGLVWVGIAIPVAILALSGNQIFIVIGILMVVALVAWWVLRRRRSANEPTADGP